MKRILNQLLLAGALILLPGFSATAKQSSAPAAQPNAAPDPQAKAAPQATSGSPHHHGRSSATRHHGRRKTSAKH